MPLLPIEVVFRAKNTLADVIGQGQGQVGAQPASAQPVAAVRSIDAELKQLTSRLGDTGNVINRVFQATGGKIDDTAKALTALKVDPTVVRQVEALGKALDQTNLAAAAAGKQVAAVSVQTAQAAARPASVAVTARTQRGDAMTRQFLQEERWMEDARAASRRRIVTQGIKERSQISKEAEAGLRPGLEPQLPFAVTRTEKALEESTRRRGQINAAFAARERAQATDTAKAKIQSEREVEAYLQERDNKELKRSQDSARRRSAVASERREAQQRIIAVQSQEAVRQGRATPFTPGVVPFDPIADKRRIAKRLALSSKLEPAEIERQFGVPVKAAPPPDEARTQAKRQSLIGRSALVGGFRQGLGAVAPGLSAFGSTVGVAGLGLATGTFGASLPILAALGSLEALRGGIERRKETQAIGRGVRSAAATGFERGLPFGALETISDVSFRERRLGGDGQNAASAAGLLAQSGIKDTEKFGRVLKETLDAAAASGRDAAEIIRNINQAVALLPRSQRGAAAEQLLDIENRGNITPRLEGGSVVRFLASLTGSGIQTDLKTAQFDANLFGNISGALNSISTLGGKLPEFSPLGSFFGRLAGRSQSNVEDIQQRARFESAAGLKRDFESRVKLGEIGEFYQERDSQTSAIRLQQEGERLIGLARVQAGTEREEPAVQLERRAEARRDAARQAVTDEEGNLARETRAAVEDERNNLRNLIANPETAQEQRASAQGQLIKLDDPRTAERNVFNEPRVAEARQRVEAARNQAQQEQSALDATREITPRLRAQRAEERATFSRGLAEREELAGDSQSVTRSRLTGTGVQSADTQLEAAQREQQRALADQIDLRKNVNRREALTLDQLAEQEALAAQRVQDATRGVELAKLGGQLARVITAERELDVAANAALGGAELDKRFAGQQAVIRGDKLGATSFEKAEAQVGGLQGQRTGLLGQQANIKKLVEVAEEQAKGEGALAEQAKLRLPGLQLQQRGVNADLAINRLQLDEADRRQAFAAGAPLSEKAAERRQQRAINRQVRRGERRQEREREDELGPERLRPFNAALEEQRFRAGIGGLFGELQGDNQGFLNRGLDYQRRAVGLEPLQRDEKMKPIDPDVKPGDKLLEAANALIGAAAQLAAAGGGPDMGGANRQPAGVPNE